MGPTPVIEIKFRTNIPTATDFTTLTSDLFATQLKATSKFPYFRVDVAFTEEMITSERLAFSFFFNEAEFQAGIKGATVVKDVQKTASSNVMFLMQTLFVTSFPIKNNFENSYETLLLQARTLRSNGMVDLFSEWLYPSRATEFTYLKLGQTYTVLGVTWINDVINNSRYSRLFDTICAFVKTKAAKEKTLTASLKTIVTTRIKQENLLKLAEMLRLPPTTTQPDILDWVASFKKMFDVNDVKNAYEGGGEKRDAFVAKLAPMMYRFYALQTQNMEETTSYYNNVTLQISEPFKKFTDSNFRALLVIFNDYYIKYQLRQFWAGENATMREALMKSSDIPLTDLELASVQSNLAADADFLKMISLLLEFLPLNTFVASREEKNPILLKAKSPASVAISTNLHLQEELLAYLLSGAETNMPLETFAKSYLKMKEESGDSNGDAELQHIDVVQIVTSEKMEKFEIELQVEVIEGALTKANVDAIRCAFEDKRLQLEYQRLKEKKQDSAKYYSRPFFKLDQFIEKRGGGRTKRRRRRRHASVHRRI
jgi:hypothetical protein